MLQQRERGFAKAADVGGQRALRADERIGHHLGPKVVGRGGGLGGQRVGGACKRLQLAGLQGRAGSDDAVDGP